MMKKTIITLIFILLSFNAFSQINDTKIRKQVLEQDSIGKEFVFGKWTEDSGTETRLKYLGLVKTEKGKTYKVMTSVLIWGLSHRATNRILIFDETNRYLGNYYVATTCDLPNDLTGGFLLFKNECDDNLITKVNLKNGLPKEIHRKGDIYTFDGE